MARTAFLFSGQGAQYVGMAQQLCSDHVKARELFDQATDLLGYPLLEVCEKGPSERLNSTAISQPAIFVASLAALESLRESDPQKVEQCEAAAGLSLGEYTALVFAGAIEFADGLQLVQKRGEAMQAASDKTASGMVSVLGLELQQVEELCQKATSAGLMKVANLLCPRNIVVSGEIAACDEIEKLAADAGAMKTIRLSVAGAFHTEIMKPTDAVLADALAEMDIKTPRIPVWSNVDAKPHTDLAEIRELLVRQVLNPVLWETTMRNLLDHGVEEFYELGPGRVLAGLLKRVHRKTPCINVSA